MRPMLLVLLAVFAACPPAASDADAGSVDAGFATSKRQALRWKRHRALQNDLSRALALTSDEVCQEAGGRPCATTGPVTLLDLLEAAGISNPTVACAALQGRSTCTNGTVLELQTPRGVHVNALGGNEPFLGETFTPLAEPLLTTPLAVDRLVLSACGARVLKDAAGPAVVFSQVDLGAPVVTRDTAGVTAQVQSLFQRLLSRDATAPEVDAVLGVLDGPTLTGREFAQLSCFTIATSTEFLFQ